METQVIQETFEKQLKALEAKIDKGLQQDKLSLIVFSGDMDKTMAALILASGAAAMGTEVHVFFTFWGTSILKKEGPQKGGKHILQSLFGWMLPKGTKSLPLSKMNFCGFGPVAMKMLMKKYKTPSHEELIKLCEEMEANFYVCQMSMELMGIAKEEIRDFNDLQYCGVAKFLEVSANGRQTLFI